jgi:hypothetical protein
MEDLTKHRRCGWCRKKFRTEKRIVENVPIGAECVEHLPETIRIAVVNLSCHDWQHGMPRADEGTAQQIVDKAFGGDIDLLLIITNIQFHGISQTDISIYYQVDNEMNLIHTIEGDRHGEILYGEDENENFYTDKQLLWKRRVALMLHPKTKTKLEVVHIDASWVWFINGGFYDGPIPADADPSEHGEERGWKTPIPLCQHCDAFTHIDEEHSELTERQDNFGLSLENEIECYLCYGLLEKMIAEAEEEINNLEEMKLDIRLHPMYHRGHLFGDLDLWVPEELNEEFEQLDGAYDLAGNTPHWESEAGQWVLTRLILPIFFRQMSKGFDLEWIWTPGVAKITPSTTPFMDRIEAYNLERGRAEEPEH